MQILLANDDGIHSPGLRAIYDQLIQLGDVEVVAPSSEQSGVGHSVTYRSPLQVEEVFDGDEHFGWAVQGSPADCVKLGVLEFCKTKPDLVVSGINSGANYGINVLYSGTVAAAIEGAFFGIRSIAISLDMQDPPDFTKTARHSLGLVQKLIELPDTQDQLWSINFPPSKAKLAGVRFVSMGINREQETLEKRLDPQGKPYFWSGTDPLENHSSDPGTDIEALSEHFVTITPLKYDLTDHQLLGKVRDEHWPLSDNAQDL